MGLQGRLFGDTDIIVQMTENRNLKPVFQSEESNLRRRIFKTKQILSHAFIRREIIRLQLQVIIFYEEVLNSY